MTPPDEPSQEPEPRIKGFDPARGPRVVRMRDPEMAGRRQRTREGRARKRVREQRGKLGIFLVSGIVLISLIGLTCWNVLSRNRELDARTARPAAPADAEELKEAKTEPVSEPDVEEGPVKGAEDKRTVSDKQRELETARNQYLSRPAPGEASRGASEGSGDAEVSAADKERVLRQVMPFYRSRDQREAPPVPAEELYIKTPGKK